MPTHNINDKQAPDMCLKSTEEDAIDKYSLGRELSNVFSEDYDVVEKIILDPWGPVLNRWNKIFLLACLLSLFVDPLFFYLPVAKEEACIENMESLEVAITIIRSMIDAFYVVQIFVRFRTTYVAPSSRVFGRGELVIDPSKIASRYLRKDFWLDLVTALPLPQKLIWAAIPNLRGSEITLASIVVRFLIIFQYLLRLYHIYPLTSEIVKANGVMMETAWAGAVYNLMLCKLASHFGIYGEAVTSGTTASRFFNKYYFCLWWGLRNLSSLRQNLVTSAYIGEISFAFVVVILGLVLFALLIGNMQVGLAVREHLFRS
ncbi:hypothetical protein CMV_009952 [Castanea mollissima]|uniref:Ion transport domain-containing protein n=1 Tax=Castanea mollissima TaxID=60419 RepID=A0A8J4R4S7_9ROSI|nr:hypothetical protein CMV_009952 [Castanea mollissima]